MKNMFIFLFLIGISGLRAIEYTISVTNNTNIQFHYDVVHIISGPFCKDDSAHHLEGDINANSHTLIPGRQDGGMNCCIDRVRLRPTKRIGSTKPLPGNTEHRFLNGCRPQEITINEVMRDSSTALLVTE